ncbi:4-hydroxybenzaldehyde dehydrogenase [Desulfacinum infernum DSM 9756]|uniref:Salicylaldehyde dehydrogenase n=1 Tax=Desulfacinum infernum DSM 9756 TaxID=1121391 RepID=A0A1M4XZI1_9BACT|nr:aldehyde dehydrogenase family protein [Desulfacinum infernum]SHE98642.1 4-hydroxybenzaldehyde dehydrogenase [Desulfacinum infernum DSM 9756]
MKRYPMFIGGKWVDARSGEYFDDINPYTGEVYAHVAKGDERDADSAMAAAYEARKAWASTPPAQRAAVLSRAAAILEAERREFAEVLTSEGGGTSNKVLFEISQTMDLLHTAAADCKAILGSTYQTDPEKLSITVRSPKGTVVAISPWNFPLILSMYKVAYALGTGNTVVLKPSSETPVIGLKIGELFQKAGLTPGALNVVTGPGRQLGDALIADERCSLVTLTGSTETGRHVAKKAAERMKETVLELGGKNPLIILSDADLDLAVSTAAFGTFLHQGQICMSVGRIIIEAKAAQAFAEKLAKKAARLAKGDPALPQTVVGPLINDEQVRKVDQLVRDAVDKGAELLHGGRFEGRVYDPTVLLGVNPGMRIYHEEAFGPVASIIPVQDEIEALRVANDNEYGLSAAVLTRDIHKALHLAEGLEAGMVHVNDSTIHAEACCPFGGLKGSGHGREGGRFSIEAYTDLKWLTIQKGVKQYPF